MSRIVEQRAMIGQHVSDELDEVTRSQLLVLIELFVSGTGNERGDALEEA